VPAAGEPADPGGGLLHRHHRRHHHPGAHPVAAGAEAGHRPDPLRPGHDPEPDDRPAASATGHGAVRAGAGVEAVGRADHDGDPALAGAAVPGADHHHVLPQREHVAAGHDRRELNITAGAGFAAGAADPGEPSMPGRLEGKTAFVTAAGQGIGRATALAFAREGATVLAADLNPQALAGLEECTPVTLDVTDAAAVARAVEAAGPVDILFNGAGFVHAGTILDCDDAAWDFSFDLNV